MKFKKRNTFTQMFLKIGRYDLLTLYDGVDYNITVIDDKNYIYKTHSQHLCIARRKLYKIIKELRRKRDEDDLREMAEELWKPLEGKKFDELPKKEIRKMYRDAFMEGLREGFNEDIRMWQAIALVLFSMLIVYLSLNI